MSRSSRPACDAPVPQALTPRAAALLPLGAMAAGFGLALAPALSAAQATAADAAAPSQLPKVSVRARAENDRDSARATTTTIGKGTQDIRDIPQSVTVLTEKIIDDAKLTTLREALRYTAGITFAATENGTDQDIRLRGFPVASVGDLLIDGMRDPSQYDRDTFNLDRIEVMRGAASMLFGRGSTGGVVNQVTKKPMLVDQADVVGTVGTRGFVRATVDYNRRTGEDSALRLNLMANRADNGGAEIRKYGFAPSFSWGLGTRDEFTLGAFLLDYNNTPPSAIRWLAGASGGGQSGLAPVDPGAFYGYKSDILDGRAGYLNGSHVHRFDDGSQLRTQFRAGEFNRTQWSSAAGFCGAAANANGGCPAGSPAVGLGNFGNDTVVTRGTLTPRKDRYKLAYLQSDYSKQFQWGGMRHEVLAGFDAARESANRFQNNGFTNPFPAVRPPTTVGNPDDGVSLPFGPQWRNSSNYAVNALGIYAQDLVQVAPAWKVLGGVRWDRFRGNFQQLNINNTTGVVTPVESSISQSPWSYRAGVLYQPTPSASFHVSYGTSFTTAADTYQFTTPQNANTPPEKSRNIEIGAKLDWLDNQLSTRVAFFRTEKYNERTTDADFAGTAFLLSGKRHSQGVELDVVGRLAPTVEVYLSTSYIPVAVIDQAGTAQANVVGQRVGLTPKLTAASWLSWQATPKLRVAGGLRASGDNFPLQGTNGAAQTTVRAPRYVVGDLMAEYKFTSDLYAQVNVWNVANKRYADQLYPGFAILGTPRTVLASVGWRY